jgi:hypothetical protein
MADLLDGCEGRQLGAQRASGGEEMLAAIDFRETERVGELGVTPTIEIVEEHDLALHRRERRECSE